MPAHIPFLPRCREKKNWKVKGSTDCSSWAKLFPVLCHFQFDEVKFVAKSLVHIASVIFRLPISRKDLRVIDPHKDADRRAFSVKLNVSCSNFLLSETLKHQCNIESFFQKFSNDNVF